MKMTAHRLLKSLLLLSVCLLCAQARGGGNHFRNPVLESGADPWIVRHSDGFYYYCSWTTGGIGVSRSENLHEISPVRGVWSPRRRQWNSTNIWAPELHHWRGKWYIFYAAGHSGPPFIHQRVGVLESETDDAMGWYIDRGMLYTGDSPGVEGSNRWAIDMTLLEHDGQLYAVWSGWADDALTDKTPQHLYIARMDDPCTISSARVMISTPDRPYELNGQLPINEGPQVLKNGEDVFIVYSCGQSWLPSYKLACLRLKPGADPMLPDSWTKSDRPVFEGTKHVHGVGHASFTTSPDGTQHYIVYHAKKDEEPGWARDVRIQRFRFGRDGAPVFGKPVPLSRKLPLPSGTVRNK